MKNPNPKRLRPTLPRIGWRVSEYQEALPFSPAQIAEWLATGELESVKVGGARVITISPEDFLNRYRGAPARAA